MPRRLHEGSGVDAEQTRLSKSLDAHVEWPPDDQGDPQDVGVSRVSNGDLPALGGGHVHTDQTVHNERRPGSGTSSVHRAARRVVGAVPVGRQCSDAIRGELPEEATGHGVCNVCIRHGPRLRYECALPRQVAGPQSSGPSLPVPSARARIACQAGAEAYRDTAPAENADHHAGRVWVAAVATTTRCSGGSAPVLDREAVRGVAPCIAKTITALLPRIRRFGVGCQ